MHACRDHHYSPPGGPIPHIPLFSPLKPHGLCEITFHQLTPHESIFRNPLQYAPSLYSHPRSSLIPHAGPLLEPGHPGPRAGLHAHTLACVKHNRVLCTPYE